MDFYCKEVTDDGTQFHIRFDGDDTQAAFKAGIDRFKHLIPWTEREYDSDSHVWTVDATPVNEQVLSEKIERFSEQLEITRSQLDIFE